MSLNITKTAVFTVVCPTWTCVLTALCPTTMAMRTHRRYVCQYHKNMCLDSSLSNDDSNANAPHISLSTFLFPLLFFLLHLPQAPCTNLIGTCEQDPQSLYNRHPKCDNCCVRKLLLVHQKHMPDSHRQCQQLSPPHIFSILCLITLHAHDKWIATQAQAHANNSNANTPQVSLASATTLLLPGFYVVWCHTPSITDHFTFVNLLR